MSNACRQRRWKHWIIVLITLAVSSVVTASWFAGSTLIASANREVPKPVDIPVVATTIRSNSGTNIAAWELHAPDATATVILLHPIRSNRLAMLSRAKLFRDAGFSVVLIDFQAHGESVGDCLGFGALERHDVAATVDFVRNRQPQHRIAIVGWSLGGAAALLASPLEIDALVVESVYSTIETAVNNRLEMRMGSFGTPLVSPLLLSQLKPRLGISSDELRPLDHVGRVACPIMILGGELDRHTTLDETQRLFDEASEPKELVIFERAAHCDFLHYDADLYCERVLAFLARHLQR